MKSSIGKCNYCGKPLKVAWDRKTVPKTPTQTSSLSNGQRFLWSDGSYVWVCYDCKTKFRDDLKFAGGMGYSLQPTGQRLKQEVKEKVEFGATILLFLFAAIGMLIFIILMMHSGQADY